MNPYFIAGTVLAVIFAYGAGHYKGDVAGQAKIQQEWDKEKAKQLAAYAQAQEEARLREQELQDGAVKLRQEKDREIREINARATGLLASLQHRPERTSQASGVSTNTGACAGANGAELARGDAIFLAGYSADVAKLQATLDLCISQYESIKKRN